MIDGRDSAQLAVADAQGARDAADSVDPRKGGGGLPKRLWEPRAPRLAIPPGGQLGLETAEIGGIKFRCAHDAPQHADRRKFLHARLPKQHVLGMKDLKQIAEDALHLTVAERVTLAESLLLTVPESEDILVDTEILDEAERRLAQLRSGAVKPVPASEVIDRARSAIRSRN